MRKQVNMKLARSERYFARNQCALSTVTSGTLLLGWAYLLIQGKPAVDMVAVTVCGSLVVGVVSCATSSVMERSHLRSAFDWKKKLMCP